MNGILRAWTALTAAALILALRGVPAELRGQSSDIFIRSERWLDPVSGRIQGPIVIRIAGDRIAQLMPAAEYKAAGTPIDLGNSTILPGLIDAHVHLQIGGAPSENACTVLRAGFTTVVDLGATSDAVLRLRDRIVRKE